jgi:hypothetical protein
MSIEYQFSSIFFSAVSTVIFGSLNLDKISCAQTFSIIILLLSLSDLQGSKLSLPFLNFYSNLQVLFRVFGYFFEQIRFLTL